MGNCTGLFHKKDVKDEQVPAGAGGDKTKPMIFALMRNGHEVIRGNIVEIEEFLSKGNLENAVKSYHHLHKWMSMHMRMEEGHTHDIDEDSSPKQPMGFFSVLDKRFDGIAKKRHLRDDHSALEVVETSLLEAGEEGDIKKFKKLFDEYKKVNEAHLLKEEEVMMPKVQEMIKSGVNMKEMMINDILALVVNSSDFKFFVQHANYVLDKYSGEMPKVRVFDHALWACATAKQWKEWKVWIKESLPKARFEEVMAVVGNLDQDGNKSEG